MLVPGQLFHLQPDMPALGRIFDRVGAVSYTHLIYLLPSTYNCYGITYNKTLLKKYGWELPNSFAELEALAAKAKEAGVDLCLPQIQYPGSSFQYLCNIADADFLGTLDGRLWQKDYLSGKANVSNTPGMMQAMAYVQKWKDIGICLLYTSRCV